MDSGRPDHVEENSAELPKIRTRREAAWRDEYEVAVLPQQRGADRHEQRVDVRLAVDHLGRGRRAGIVLADLEVGRVGDDDVEVVGFRPPGEKPARTQSAGIRHDEVGGFDVD